MLEHTVDPSKDAHTCTRSLQHSNANKITMTELKG